MARAPIKIRRNSDARREVLWKPLDSLLLDNQNPRLPDGFEQASQSQLLSILAKDYDLLDIGRSIAANGYFSEEPLVTVSHPTAEKWIVVEGNRRLAALLLLSAPNKAPKDLRDEWTEVADSSRPPREIPILVYESRDEITPYLGFRHITGVLEWRPYQKGRYIAQLVEESKLGFAAIAGLIGSRPKTVKEHYVTYTLARQARDAFNIDIEAAQDSFGNLRRSLSEPGIREFIGLNLDRAERDLAKPLPKAKAKQVAELFAWMFGTDEKDAALNDSRQIPMLGSILANEKSCAALRSTNNITYAFELSGGEEQRLVDSLSKASYQLDQALPMALRHKSSRNVVGIASKCLEVMLEIARLLNLQKKGK